MNLADSKEIDETKLPRGLQNMSWFLTQSPCDSYCELFTPKSSILPEAFPYWESLVITIEAKSAKYSLLKTLLYLGNEHLSQPWTIRYKEVLKDFPGKFISLR